MIKAIFFDLDETLIDYRASERRGLAAVCSALGIAPSEELFEIYRAENSRLWSMVETGQITPAELRAVRFCNFVDQAEISASVSAPEMSEIYLRAFAESDVLIDGARELLEYVGSLGRIKTAVATNGFGDTQRRRLAVTGLDRYFDEFIISGELGLKKPDRAFFRTAFSRLGIEEPERCVMIGDNLLSDMQGGREAGMITCWYNPDGAPVPESHDRPDYEVSELSALKPILNELFHGKERAADSPGENGPAD
jgi:2-haloacid dehalogenase